MNNGCIIVFVKSPEKGNVKSRLAASIGKDFACALYKRFVGDLLGMLRKNGYLYVISFYPPDAGRDMEKWLGKDRMLIPQQGENLGERMENAFKKVFSEGFGFAVLIGSDSPDLPKLLIEKSFASLRGHDAVIGPSLDGGYYLIGFNRNTFAPSVFEGIEWSSASVFNRTMGIFKKTGCRVRILPEWRDIDTLNDLKALYYKNLDSDFAASSTMKYLRSRKNKIRIFQEDLI